MTGPLTRVTLAGPRRRVDLAVPSDEPVGMLLPEILALTAHRPGADPAAHCLTLLDGRVVAPASSLRESGVPDGAVLRIAPRAEPPPAAVLLELSDEVADDLGTRPGRWADGPRSVTATVAVVVAVCLGTALIPGPSARVLAVVLGGGLLLYGALAGAVGIRPLGPALVLAGAAAVLVPLPALAGDPWYAAGAVVAGTAVAVAALGVAAGRARAGVIGAAVLLGHLAAWAGLLAAGTPVARAGAVLAVVAIALLGTLPRFVLVAAGLTRLDDQLVEGRPVARAGALSAIDTAHRGLVPAVAATAASAAAAGVALAGEPTGWTLSLAGALAVVLLLRLRAYPLTAQVVVLLAASLVVAGALVAHLAPGPSWPAAGACLLVGAAAAAVLVRRPAPHVMARARRVADRVEGLAAMAALPLAVGVFGVYARLLEVFAG